MDSIHRHKQMAVYKYGHMVWTLTNRSKIDANYGLNYFEILRTWENKYGVIT